VTLTDRTCHSSGPDGQRDRRRGTIHRRGPIRLGAAALSAVAAAAVLAVTAPAGAGTNRVAPVGDAPRTVHVLHLQAMPHGSVVFGRWHHRLTAHVIAFGLTPGSAHAVRLEIPGSSRIVRFSTLTASSGGGVNSVLRSHFTGHLPWVGRLVIRMGTGAGHVARQPIAETRWLRHPRHRAHRLVAVEVSAAGVIYGTPRGRATISYNPRRHTLTVTVHATRLTPGPHAAHIHTGSCQHQGPVLYMLRDLVANSQGTIRHAVRVFTNVTKPIPAHGWYLNIHQGNSKDIAKNGQPTILFRPLLCRNIH